MRAMKDSGLLWIETIPDNWETYSIRHLFSFGKGLPITKDDLKESGIPVVSYGQVHSKANKGIGLCQSLIRFVDESYRDSNPESLTKIGDFIFADTSEDVAGCGNCAFVDRDTTLFAGYHTIILRSKNQTSNKYLAYLFLTDAWRKQIRERVAGIKVFSVSQKILRETTIIVPPATEQRRIVEFLDDKCARIDAVMEQTRASIEEYKKLKQSIITEAVTKGIRPNRPMKDSGIPWIGMIPSDWDVALLKYSIRWKSVKGKPDAQVLSLYRDHGVIPKDSRDDNYNVTSLDTGTYKVVDVGDFVINKMKAWQGSMAISNYIGIVSPAYHVCEVINPNIFKPYLHHLLRNQLYIPEYMRLSTGMRIGQWDLGFDDFRNLPFILPSFVEQTEIVDYINTKGKEIDALIQTKQDLIEEMESYKKSLIYEYVTGKKEA